MEAQTIRDEATIAELRELERAYYRVFNSQAKQDEYLANFKNIKEAIDTLIVFESTL